MSVKILNENLKSKNFSTLYYIFGEEEYLKNFYFSQLKSNVVQDLPEFNITEFDSKTYNFLDFSNSVNSYPMMAEKKLVTVVDFDNSVLKGNASKELSSFLKTIPEFCVVAFFDSQAKTITPSNPLQKLIASAGGVCVEVKKPDMRSLSSWVNRHFKSYNKTISTEDMNYLIDIADCDMMSLDNEINKLCTYVTGEIVTKGDIDKIVTRSIETNRYEIADAFCNKNYSKIFEIVDLLYKQCVEDIVIANLFYRAFSDIWKAKLSSTSRKSASDLSKDFKLNPYAVNRILKNADKLPLSVLERIVHLSLRLDIDLKSTPFDKKGLLLTYVASIIDIRENYGKINN